MTATTFLPQTPWRITDISGTSVQLSAPLPKRPQLDAAAEEASDSLPVFWVPTGVSGGAVEIERLVQQLWVDLSRLLMTPPVVTSLDVEQEIAVLLPPKRQRTVTVRVHHAGRAAPLISFDELMIEHDGD